MDGSVETLLDSVRLFIWNVQQQQQIAEAQPDHHPFRDEKRWRWSSNSSSNNNNSNNPWPHKRSFFVCTEDGQAADDDDEKKKNEKGCLLHQK